MKFIAMLLFCVAALWVAYTLVFILKLGLYVFIIVVVLSIPQVRSGIKYLFYK